MLFCVPDQCLAHRDPVRKEFIEITPASDFSFSIYKMGTQGMGKDT